MKFNPDEDIPDLSGKIIIVTGGTDGLGKQSVLQLSKHNPSKIYLAARSQSKAEAAITQIRESSPLSSTCDIEFLQLDLTSFESIKSAAQSFLSKESRLDILLANAGILGSKATTVDGYEITMGTNHLGHALFIRLLLPIMSQTASSPDLNEPRGDVRCVILGSEAEAMAPKTYPFDQLRGPQANSWQFVKYGQSKLANIHYTQQLALHYPEETSRIRFVCVHPGGVSTNIGNEMLRGWPTTQKVVRKVVTVLLGLVSVEEGALNQLWACTADANGKGVPAPENGAFYFPVAVSGKGSKKVTDKDMAAGLWDWTEGIIGPELNGPKE